jgi:hypothetical protein
MAERFNGHGAKRLRGATLRRSPRVLLGGGILLALGLLLGAAYLLQSDGPRTLPFPTVDPRSPFPELTRPVSDDNGESSSTRPPATRASRFERALQQAARNATASATSESPQSTSSAGTATQTVPLGGTLVAKIPADPSAWRWSADKGTTLIVHAPGNGRPDALILAEPFAATIADRPTAELHRFHVAVDPLGRGGSPLLGTFLDQMRRKAAAEGSAARRARLLERARAAQILATKTLGRGLGFTPADEGVTGERWVGRTDNELVLRLSRSEGTWGGQRELPVEIAAAVEAAARSAVDQAAARAPALAATPAYLLVGSVATRTERFGAHVAILCSTSPRCPVAEELATFLASIESGDTDLLDRLRDGFHAPFDEVARAAGLDLPGPIAPEESETEETKPVSTPPPAAQTPSTPSTTPVAQPPGQPAAPGTAATGPPP